jgi:hypothetical protein
MEKLRMFFSGVVMVRGLYQRGAAAASGAPKASSG